MENKYNDKNIKALQEYIKIKEGVDSVEELEKGHKIIVIGAGSVGVEMIKAEMLSSQLPVILVKDDLVVGVKDNPCSEVMGRGSMADLLKEEQKKLEFKVNQFAEHKDGKANRRERRKLERKYKKK